MAIQEMNLSIPMAQYGTSAGIEQVYDIDSAVITGDVLGTVSSDKLTLPAGTYVFEGVGVLYQTQNTTMRLYDVTGGDVLLSEGVFSYAASGQSVSSTPSMLTGKITFGAQVDIEFRLFTSGANVSGMGSVTWIGYGNSAQFTVTKYL